jgi:hypothetical protein
MFSDFVKAIIYGDPLEIKESFKNVMDVLLEQKLHEKKRMIVAEQFGEFDEVELLDEKLNNNVQKMGRLKLIRLRVRNGKVQRRKKLSNTKGYTIRHGHLMRMSQLERRHRKLGARRAKIKRRAERSKILRKLHIALRRRHNLGL